jgi:hypothetical protein
VRPWILVGLLLATIAALGAGFWIMRPGGEPHYIDWYRVVDADTLSIRVWADEEAETRVTDVVETSDSVTITVRSFVLDIGYRAPAAIPKDLTVDLQQPLGNRLAFSPRGSVPPEP